jgi:hypothetical protein
MIVVDVACKGPDTAIALSAPASWNFDAVLDVQPVLEISVLLQEVALAATGEDGGASGINTNQADNRAEDAGAVYVFR